MAKKTSSIYDLSGVDPVQEISRHLNKHGKLTGEKKEKKALRSICPHHALNRKGRVKPRIHKEGDKNCQCDICKDRFKAGFYDDMEYSRAYNGMKPIASQAKLLTIATGSDKRTVREVAEFNLRLDRFEKTYKGLRKISQKQDKIKNKKKNKNRNTGDYGGWRTNG